MTFSYFPWEQMLYISCHIGNTRTSASADGDIYGSEGQYHRYEEGDWDDDMDEHLQDVSSGQVYPQGRSGRSFDRYSDDNMGGHDNVYVTPETTAPLQPADQVSLDLHIV